MRLQSQQGCDGLRAAEAGLLLSPKLALLAAEAWCMGAEADASLKRLTAPGVVQLQAERWRCWMLAPNVIKHHPCWRCTQSGAIPHA